jgi:hypothetical protein
LNDKYVRFPEVIVVGPVDDEFVALNDPELLSLQDEIFVPLAFVMVDGSLASNHNVQLGI